jgi:phosphoribosylanthranilate isomerase
MRLKVCGMTDPAQLDALEKMGVTFGGLIFYPKSPRYALRHMTTQQIKNLRTINKVGVFVNASIDEIKHMVDECRLQMVQLHGDETPKFCEKIADYISVVKVFRIAEGDNIAYKIRDYMNVCDMFLFDTAPVMATSTDHAYGGTGQKFNWNLLKNVNVGKPYFLSGGIGPDDVADVQQFMKEPAAKGLFALDINSKFEISPGIKDMSKVRDFYNQIKLL